MKTKFTVLLILFMQVLVAQKAPFTEEDVTINEFIDGTFTSPESGNSPWLVILIQGSGPTDRNGNQPMLKSNYQKKIAHELAKNNIASFRFDKRINKMQKLKIKEEDFQFDFLVDDVNSIVQHFRTKGTFKSIILAGHSQGSLVALIAAQADADAVISIAGPGKSIDEVIVEQIKLQAPGLEENARTAFDELIANGKTTNYNPFLGSIFRPSGQNFMMSWIKYDPAIEITKLNIPILIVNGTNDIQSSVQDAELLKMAKPDAQLEIIENMNHILREIKTNDNLVNTKSYNEPGRPLHPQLIPILTEFIKEQGE